MNISINIPDETVSAIQYCIDNKLLPTNNDTETVNSLIESSVDSFFAHYVVEADKHKDVELLTTLKATPELKAEIDAVITNNKLSIDTKVNLQRN
jgi:hypothetical protein